MKRNKYKDYLWYTALAVFIICVIEGVFFYHIVAENLVRRQPGRVVYARTRHQSGTVTIESSVDNTTHFVAKISSFWYFAARTAVVPLPGSFLPVP